MLKKVLLFLSVVTAVIFAAAFISPRRAGLVWDHMRGRVDVADGCSVFTPGILESEDRFLKVRTQVRELKRDGSIALYETPIGSLWYKVGAWTLPAVVEENQSDPYKLRSTIKQGDIVLDVGANMGTDTRSALIAGASLVVAIEPEPLTLECLRRNLATEIRENRVVVVEKGAWDKEDRLLLHVDTADAGGSSLIQPKIGPSIEVPLTTIDRIVADLKLPKVDLIKMDIEGSEKNALLGATGTIRRFHPRLSIVLEHNLDDVNVLPSVAREIYPGYHVTLTPCTKTNTLIHPEVALITP